MRGLVHIVLRTFGALLLAFAIVSPAAAEVACSQDTAAHLALGEVTWGDVASDIADPDHAFVDGDPDDHDARPDLDGPDPDGHCAFSHSHCGGIPTAIAAPRLTAMTRAFEAGPPAAFASFRLLGPDRPPRG